MISIVQIIVANFITFVLTILTAIFIFVSCMTIFLIVEHCGSLKITKNHKHSSY